MGIRGCSKRFLADHSLVTETCYNFEDESIYLDLLGTFYPEMQTAVMRQDFNILVAMIKKYFPPSRKVTIVIDGNTKTAEKSETFDCRNERRNSQLTKLGATVNLSLARIQSNIKITKNTWKIMGNLIKSTAKLNARDKEEITALLESAGYTVVLAKGEADVWIAQQSSAKTRVVSQDSDTLFHQNLEIWYRPRRDQGPLCFDVISKEDVLKQLRLSSSKIQKFSISSNFFR